MTEDASPDNFDIIWKSNTTDKIEKAFKEIRGTTGEKFEPEANFDFGSDDFSWM